MRELKARLLREKAEREKNEERDLRVFKTAAAVADRKLAVTATEMSEHVDCETITMKKARSRTVELLVGVKPARKRDASPDEDSFAKRSKLDGRATNSSAKKLVAYSDSDLESD